MTKRTYRKFNILNEMPLLPFLNQTLYEPILRPCHLTELVPNPNKGGFSSMLGACAQSAKSLSNPGLKKKKSA